MRYQANPVIIEAVQWNGENFDEIKTFMGVVSFCDHKVHISTLEGTMEASPGDFIVKGMKDEFWPVKPDIFALKYKALPE